MSQSQSEIGSCSSLSLLTHPTVSSYFDLLSAANFQEIANLFAPDGQLLPPFESAITGKTDILTYLEAEAQGFQAFPQEFTQQLMPTGQVSVEVTGKVQTPQFTVNVKWQFLLSDSSEILKLKLKLLATLKDLLQLKR